VESAAEMYTQVMQHIVDQDIMIAAAAVADYTPTTVQAEKIKKQNVVFYACNLSAIKANS
jgi:phosphopantothenoylcysteine decarboxylase/phosphopantothenate--cysteine ligase